MLVEESWIKYSHIEEHTDKIDNADIKTISLWIVKKRFYHFLNNNCIGGSSI